MMLIQSAALGERLYSIDCIIQGLGLMVYTIIHGGKKRFSTFIYMCVRMYHGVHVEVRGQFVAVSSLILPCRSLGLNSGS